MSLVSQAEPTTAESQSALELNSLLHGAGTASLVDIGWIRITGEDRVRWLNGMVTNSILELAPGDGCYTFLLSAQGRIQGTAYVFSQPDCLLLQTGRTYIPGLLALLERFIIMDDVGLGEVADAEGIVVIGPEAAALVGRLGLSLPAAPISLRIVGRDGARITLVAAHSPLVARFELWSDGATTAKLAGALISAGAEACTPETVERLRLLEGTPRYGIDIRDRELPQETSQPHALHFSKGCYLGQEIVERIRSRGAVHRTFSGFRIGGTLPMVGAPIECDGKGVGELTSVGAVPLRTGTLQIGFGYIRREILERAHPFITAAGAELSPISLPVRET